MRRAIFLKVARQFVVILNRDLGVKERAEILQVMFLDDDDHLLNAGLQGFFNDQQDGWLGNPVPVNDGKKLFLGSLGGREESCAKAGCRDDRFANLLARAQGKLQAAYSQIALDDLDHCLLIRRAAGDELSGAIAL